MAKIHHTEKEEAGKKSIYTTTTTTLLPGLNGFEVIRSSPKYTKESSRTSSGKK